MIYRIRQFIRAIFARITKEEKAFYKRYLSMQEITSFEKLKVYDQKHSILVADLLKEKTGGNEEMIRLGLLHDIGKQIYPLNPIQKGIMVILDKLTKGKIQQWKGIKMVAGYYKHAQLGYDLLKETGRYEEEFLQVVRCHHMKDIKSNLHIKEDGHINIINIEEKRYLLQEADDQA